MMIIGENNFSKLIAIYGWIGLSVQSMTMIDLLKKLILLAKTNDELYELHEKVVNLKSYEGTVSPKIKHEIIEVTKIFEQKLSFFEKNPVYSRDKKEPIDIFIKPKPKPNLKKTLKPKNRKRIGFVPEKLNTPEEVVKKFLSIQSTIYKGLYLKQMEAMEISFEETIYLYKKYIAPYESENNSIKGQSIRLKDFFLKMLISKAITLEEWLAIYNITNNSSKERVIINKAITDLIIPPKDFTKTKLYSFFVGFSEAENKKKKFYYTKKISETNASFETWLYLYFQYNYNLTLKKNIINKLIESSFTLDHELIIYTLMPLNLDEKQEKARKISFFIRKREDEERVKKIIPKWQIIWESNIKEKAMS